MELHQVGGHRFETSDEVFRSEVDVVKRQFRQGAGGPHDERGEAVLVPGYVVREPFHPFHPAPVAVGNMRRAVSAINAELLECGKGHRLEEPRKMGRPYIQFSQALVRDRYDRSRQLAWS